MVGVVRRDAGERKESKREHSPPFGTSAPEQCLLACGHTVSDGKSTLTSRMPRFLSSLSPGSTFPVRKV